MCLRACSIGLSRSQASQREGSEITTPISTIRAIMEPIFSDDARTGNLNSAENGEDIKVTLIIDVYETSDILRLIQHGS